MNEENTNQGLTLEQCEQEIARLENRKVNEMEGTEFAIKRELEKIEYADTYKRLLENEDFKKLIVDGFCGDNDKKGYMADLCVPESRQSAQIALDAVSFFERKFSYIIPMAANSEETIKGLEAGLDKSIESIDVKVKAYKEEIMKLATNSTEV